MIAFMGDVDLRYKEFVDTESKNEQDNADQVKVNGSDDADEQLRIIRFMAAFGEHASNGMVNFETAGKE